MNEKIDDFEVDEYVDEKELRKVEIEEFQAEWKARRKAEIDRMFELIRQSYMAGMTIIEIKKAMGARYVTTPLKTLKISKLIENLPPITKRYRLPENLRYAFDRVRFPFVHWCHANGFDPKHAAAALQRDPNDAMADEWKAVHAMVSKDFPVAYSDEYQMPLPEYKPGYRIERERPSLTIEWNPAKFWYCGTKSDQPEEIVYGTTMDDVYKKLRDLMNIDRQAKRLEVGLKAFEQQNTDCEQNYLF